MHAGIDFNLHIVCKVIYNPNNTSSTQTELASLDKETLFGFESLEHLKGMSKEWLSVVLSK